MNAGRFRRAVLPATVALLVAVVIMGRRAALSAGPNADASALVGTWIFGPDAHVVANCGGDQPMLEPLAGATVAISAASDDAAALRFDLGCHCRLPLAVSSSDPTIATLVAPTSCELVFGLVPVSVEIQKLTLHLGAAAGTRTLDIDLVSGPSVGAVMCESTSVTTTLLPLSNIPADCGPETTAVGVLSYGPDGFRDCPLGAGRDSVQIKLYSEMDSVCPRATGSRGEGGWTLPQTSKYEAACKPSLPGGEVHYLTLPFCRVDGRAFKPLTADPTATDQFYAVLKLGDGDCPPASVEIVRQIDNEDEVGDAMTWTSIGHLGPNQTASATDSSTTLHFCFFRWAATPDETMTNFRDLGFPYAVFHDFDGPQPAWVTLKRWVYSSDELDTNRNSVSSPTGDDVAVSQFQAAVETPNHATTFDIAWVR